VRGDELFRAEIVKMYLNSAAKYINNWDLVDTSAAEILGRHLEHRPRLVLYKLGRSNNLWRRRIAMVATLYFIKLGQFEDTFRLAEQLMDDPHDLVHKATGWMLREAGKQSPQALLKFLDKHYSRLPRTALRYAVERLSSVQKKHYMRRPGKK
jgi:3-methyladenine DNA glycosylase AlkD